MDNRLLAIRQPMAAAAVLVDGRDRFARVRALHEVHPPLGVKLIRHRAPTGGDLKRLLDFVAAFCGLALLSPLLLLVGIAVRLDSTGPMLFYQRRGGYGGRTFLILKFRTMRTMDDGGAISQARSGDPRITKLGAFLRRTSLDELPQLINVLKGDMSLVGPRPHAVAHDADFSLIAPNYRMRQIARPGITGLAQVSGCRGETNSAEAVRARVECDLDYIQKWSFFLDIQILLKTFMRVVSDRQAV